MGKLIKLMVGPTEIPEQILRAMNRPSISHRSVQYEESQESVINGLKQLIGTTNDIFIITSSGTGAMEAVIQNLFSPGDKVLVPIIGTYGKQYADMCKIYGLSVKTIEFEMGETVDANLVIDKIDKETKGVFVVHNESSTGVFNDLEKIGKHLKNTNAVLITDSISGLGGLEMKMDEWGVDVVVASSQKALMSPPGLSFLSLSYKAKERIDKSLLPKYYFDLRRFEKFNLKNQTPNTPSIYTLYAVEEALNMIFEEGLDAIYSRHKDNRDYLIDGLTSLGLEILPKNIKYASPTLTAVKFPGIADKITSKLASQGIIVNQGVGEYKSEIVRIGTMGYVSKNDIVCLLNALRSM
ncbi:MAG: pyridoxal-phosphate-dependent aminotransferase family protein [Bacillota bacterium]